MPGRTRPMSKGDFAFRAHDMVTKCHADGGAIASWSANGLHFTIHDPEILRSTYFGDYQFTNDGDPIQFSSFYRQLNNYGFSGRRRGKTVTFSHPSFVRHNRDMCSQIGLVRTGGVAMMSNYAAAAANAGGKAVASHEEGGQMLLPVEKFQALMRRVAVLERKLESVCTVLTTGNKELLDTIPVDEDLHDDEASSVTAAHSSMAKTAAECATDSCRKRCRCHSEDDDVIGGRPSSIPRQNGATINAAPGNVAPATNSNIHLLSNAASAVALARSRTALPSKPVRQEGSLLPPVPPPRPAPRTSITEHSKPSTANPAIDSKMLAFATIASQTRPFGFGGVVRKDAAVPNSTSSSTLARQRPTLPLNGIRQVSDILPSLSPPEHGRKVGATQSLLPSPAATDKQNNIVQQAAETAESAASVSSERASAGNQMLAFATIASQSKPFSTGATGLRDSAPSERKEDNTSTTRIVTTQKLSVLHSTPSLADSEPKNASKLNYLADEKVQCAPDKGSSEGAFSKSSGTSCTTSVVMGGTTEERDTPAETHSLGEGSPFLVRSSVSSTDPSPGIRAGARIHRVPFPGMGRGVSLTQSDGPGADVVDTVTQARPSQPHQNDTAFDDAVEADESTENTPKAVVTSPTTAAPTGKDGETKQKEASSPATTKETTGTQNQPVYYPFPLSIFKASTTG